MKAYLYRPCVRACVCVSSFERVCVCLSECVLTRGQIGGEGMRGVFEIKFARVFALEEAWFNL